MQADAENLFSTGTRRLASELREETAFLAGAGCSGRELGTSGNTAAAFYIFRQLSDAGYITEIQSFIVDSRKGRNIIAVTPGKFDSYIVVGAYYDGIGTIGDILYPGADSNASGVSAMLALARHFKGGKELGLIFVAFDAHASELAGSREFSVRYLSEYKVPMMVNLDTIGSSLAPVHGDRADYLIALGAERQARSLEWSNRTEGLQLSYDYYGHEGFTEMFYKRMGDQKWFIEKGIPSIMFTSGITMNTNKPEDSASTLNYELLVRRIRLIAGWLASQGRQTGMKNN